MKIRRFESAQAMQKEAASAMASVLARPETHPFAVMLSGGQTPMSAYQLLADQRPSVSPHAHILFSDERLVPESSADSNFGRIRPVLRALHIPDQQILHVETEQGLSDAAAQYNTDLRAFLKEGGRIRLGFLGLGSDGHTASLFSMEDIERGRGLLAIPVERAVKPDRVSVTVSLLEQIDKIVFLVSGEDKAEIVDRCIKNPSSIPAGQAVSGNRNVALWVS